MKGAALKTLQAGEEIAGGFLVPPQLLAEAATRLPSAGVVPLLSHHTTSTPTDTVQIPLFSGADDGYPTALRFALTGAWSVLPLPATTDVRSALILGLAPVPIFTLLASVVMSRNLFEDSSIGDLDAVFAQLALSTQLATIESLALTGTGQGQPEGILANVQASGDTTRNVLSVKTGNAAALTAGGIEALFGALQAQYHAAAPWIMHPTTMQALMGLQDSSNRPLLTFEGDAGYIYGRPVILSAFMPAIAAGAYPIIFGDCSGLHWVSRSDLSVSTHDEGVAELNQVLLRLRFRAGGALAEPYRFRVQVVSS